MLGQASVAAEDEDGDGKIFGKRAKSYSDYLSQMAYTRLRF